MKKTKKNTYIQKAMRTSAQPAKQPVKQPVTAPTARAFMGSEDAYVRYATISMLSEQDKKQYSSTQAAKRLLMCEACGIYYDSKVSKKCPLCQVKMVVLELQKKYVNLKSDLEKNTIAGHGSITQAQPPGNSIKTSNGVANKINANGHAYRKGDIIKFGRLEGKPIEWIVIAVNEDNPKELYVLAKKCLEFKAYSSKRADSTWETSSLREYLNGEFYNMCFNPDERKRIFVTKVRNGDNIEYGTMGGNETNDKIFLLSDINAKSLINDNERKCITSDYAKTKAGYMDKNTGACRWWLRTPGSQPNKAASVTAVGQIVYDFDWKTDNHVGVRPAMWVDMK